MIVIISGTNRPGSNTRKVTAHVETVYKSLGVPFQLRDLAHMPPEIFSPSSYGEKPAAFKKFIDAILAADGLVVVTPEYNGGMPGVLKYFIDMLPFPESFENRPVRFCRRCRREFECAASDRAFSHLQAIFGYRNAFDLSRTRFMPEHRQVAERGTGSSPVLSWISVCVTRRQVDS